MNIELVQNLWRKGLMVLVNFALLAGLVWSVTPAIPASAATTGYVQDIDTGGWHTCALTSAGGVKCWGGNANGELGDNKVSGNSSAVPVNVCADSTCASSLNNVTAIATGRYHSCALLGTGKVKCWGYNSDGQLGNNSTTPSNAPVYVCADAGCSNDLTNVINITAGDNHTCAVIDGGGVKCWGNNSAGQLGNNNSPTDSTTPVDVCATTGCSALLGGISAVAAGGEHTCAMTTSNNAMCWGADGGGQLGNHSPYVSSGLPVYVHTSTSDTDPLSGVIAIGLGTNHSCAVVIGGGVKCWGANNAGQLGDDTTTTRPAPVDVQDGSSTLLLLLSGAVEVDGGYEHTCAVITGGGVKCWGDNNNGQLGDGNAPTDSHTAVGVSGLANANTTKGGVYHSCALMDDGLVQCWGLNGDGQLGEGTTTQRNTPVNQLWMNTYVTTAVINEGMCSGNGPCYASPTTALGFTVGNVTYSGTVNVRSGTYNESLVLDKNAAVIFENGTTLNGNLTQSNGTMTIGAPMTLNGNLEQSGGTMNAPAGTFTMNGNWIRNAGTFNHNSGSVVFNRSGTQMLGGSVATAFHNITVTSSSVVSVTTQPTASGTVANNGALQQRLNVPAGGESLFLEISTAYYGVRINPGSNSMGMTEVTIYGNRACTNATTNQVERCFKIKPTTQQSALITFFYTADESNGQSNDALDVYHWDGNVWVRETLAWRAQYSPGIYYVMASDIGEYSTFALGSDYPNAVKLNALTGVGGGWGFSVLLGFVAAFALTRRKR